MLIVLPQWHNCPRVDVSLHSSKMYIIPIPSQPVYTLTSTSCVLSGKAADTIFIVFGLTQLVFEPTNKLTSTPLMRLKCIRRYCQCCSKYHALLRNNPLENYKIRIELKKICWLLMYKDDNFCF